MHHDQAKPVYCSAKEEEKLTAGLAVPFPSTQKVCDSWQDGRVAVNSPAAPSDKYKKRVQIRCGIHGRKEAAPALSTTNRYQLLTRFPARGAIRTPSARTGRPRRPCCWPRSEQRTSLPGPRRPIRSPGC